MNKSIIVVIFFLSLLCSTLVAQVDSQWRGPNRDGKYQNEKLLKSWPPNGPKLYATLTDLGKGYSSPAVTKDRIYVTGMEDGKGNLFAFDISGKLVWKKNYGREWDDSYPGARISPTVVGNRIYFASSLGQIYCYNPNGDMIWTLDMKAEFDAPIIEWGMVESLLIEGDYLFCTPGSEDVSIAVLDRHSGKIINKIEGNGQKSAYCSPTIINHNGRKILITMLAESLIGVDLKSMKMIFEHEHTTDYDIHPNTPLYYDGFIYIVSGYGTG
ncbi:MAG: PQQ-binding-like beta-propeller repeat protein, partial [Melioribacteraceae bacterium]|nr:PQQ-binding-like beta-propeller repeat protein [Melioribacteraceae bacterium]